MPAVLPYLSWLSHPEQVRTQRCLNSLLPGVREMAKRLLSQAATKGIHLTIVHGFRSDAEQQQLYDHRPDGRRVAPPGQSWHSARRAFDVALIDAEGKLNWDPQGPWARIGELGVAVGLEWGGAGDEGHFQLREGLTLDEARAALHP